MPTPNQLHLWDDRFFYITPAIQSGLTARSSATLLACGDGRPFTLVTHGGEVLRCTAALVAPHVPRRLDADGCGLLSLNIDPASAVFRGLSDRLGGAGILPLDARCFGPRLREAFEGAVHGQLPAEALRALSVDMVHTVCGQRPGPAPMDPRVVRVLSRLQARAAEGAVPLQELAACAQLSPDRLTHLFREQTGLSIKRYLLWAKIRRAVHMLATARPLTDAALAGGFADSAHMSHAFQRCFGLPPSFLARAGQVSVVVDAHAQRVWHG
ncbi:AraC family transcriptional regulator [Acidovorax sp. SUPP2539]|uniref:helix-turn-helix domain-containing protein n=1 Tax=Acidovorax sp. SUPP2539 TaxID=2920878 RepID=UPI0023DE63D6|nr:AraC family transcriptional regulator [Acidovorax sp. SUPP2539]GKS90278.1 helix-turn-helix transcriptional regulator [Acidovorax sp. SUPP2539]